MLKNLKPRNFARASLLLTLCMVAGYTQAAPLDAFLTATPERTAASHASSDTASAQPSQAISGTVEVATEQMNGDLDLFKVRDSRVDTAGTSAGDYHGAHIVAGFTPMPGLWLSGGLWKRSLKSATDTYDYDSWQLAAQYRIIDADARWPDVALRVSAWGNRADAMESTTAVVVPGAKLNSAKISKPADQSLQLDAIGSWQLSPATQISAIVGGGVTQLSYDKLTATTTRDGCNYNVVFNGNDIFGTLAEACSASGGVIQQFYDSSGDYGVDVDKEIAWHARFVHLGVNGSWSTGNWKFSAAYLFTAIARDNVDDILASRGSASYTHNQAIALQADYHLSPTLRLFGRAQLSSNLFFDDIPVTYNSSTAYRFDSKYSLFGIGVVMDF